MPASKSIKTLNTTNQVRINGGVWRSRLIKFPDVHGLRPTPDRVRQAVFNWLGQDLSGKVCLDLFAGTGAFGFEALSRNANSVVMVENSRLALQALTRNQTLLKASNCQIIFKDAFKFLNDNKQLFDIIFCDPPFNRQLITQLLPVLNQHLSENGVLYVEAEYAIKSDSIWQVIKQNKAGNVHYHLLKSM